MLRRSLIILFILAVVATYPVLADLPKSYQSDDVDINGTVDLNNTNIEELAKYTDILFLKYPAAVSEQNKRFISAFPSTGDYESVVPEGISTKSGRIIKDAYIRLIPIEGLVKTPSGKYFADKKVKVGFVADYRVVVPPDDTEGDVRYYYSLEGTSIEVKLGDKISYSKKEIVELEPDGDIKAVATITATINVRKEEDVEVSCGNSTCIETIVTYYTLKPSITVRDVLPVQPYKQSVDVYELRDESGTVEYWILPHPGVYSIKAEDDLLVGGFSSFITYRTIKSAEKIGESSTKEIDLKEPAYEIVILPCYQLFGGNNLTIYDYLTPDSVVEEANIKLGQNIKLETLYNVKAIKLVFNKNIKILDVFGKELSQNRHVRYYLKPVVKVNVEETENSYKVQMNIFADDTPYNGPVYLTVGADTTTAEAVNGVITFETEKKYTKVVYTIPSNLPDRWYESDDTVFFKSYSGSFTLGEPEPFVVNFYRLLYTVILALPLIALYYLAKRLRYRVEEDLF